MGSIDLRLDKMLKFHAGNHTFEQHGLEIEDDKLVITELINNQQDRY